jgi:hypothetical protein
MDFVGTPKVEGVWRSAEDLKPRQTRYRRNPTTTIVILSRNIQGFTR